VVRWDTDPAKLIANVLSPGKVDKVEVLDQRIKEHWFTPLPIT